MRTEFFIAKRYLFAKKSTNAITWISWISVIGVTIGTAALFLILSVFNGFEELNLIYAKKLSPDLKIIPSLGTKFNKSSIDTNLFISPSINYYVNVLEDNVLLKYNNSQYFATLRGVSEQYLQSKEIDSVLRAGTFTLQENGQAYAVIGKGIENALGIDITQPIEQIVVLAPKQNSRLNTLDPASSLNSAAIYASGIFAVQQEMDERVMFVPIDFAESLFAQQNKLSSVDIYLNDGEDMLAYQKIIAAKLPAKFMVKNRFQLNESLYKVLNTERWAVYLVLTFILIIAICNIIGSVTMLIIDKKKDIAVLRTLGATKNQIQKIYFYEGMMISLLGTFIGLFIGAGFAILQAKFKLISIYSSTGEYLQAYPVKLIYTDFLLVFATVFIIAFIANWFSAKQSSNASNDIRWAIAAN
jgi:lipoprotein-releasing system permease protein